MQRFHTSADPWKTANFNVPERKNLFCVCDEYFSKLPNSIWLSMAVALQMTVYVMQAISW